MLRHVGTHKTGPQGKDKDTMLLQLEGQRWMQHTAQRFAEGLDVPPTLAANLVVEIASGRFDALTGRYIRVKDYKGDDLDEVEAQIPEILAKDLRTLRMR